MFFIVEKVVGVLTSPLSMTFLLVLTALLARRLRRPKLAAGMLISGLLVAYVSSISVVSDALLRPLERAHPRLNEAAPSPATRLVVLGTSYEPSADRPVTAALAGEGVVRVVEGVRLFRALHLQQLVLSGGRSVSRAPSAQGYALLARQLGADPSTLVVLDQPDNTAQEARAIHELLGSQPFILVTSASHMPRAVRLMKAAGANPVPAPTAHRTREVSESGVYAFIPRASALVSTEMALHEYIGLLAMAVGVQ